MPVAAARSVASRGGTWDRGPEPALILSLDEGSVELPGEWPQCESFSSLSCRQPLTSQEFREFSGAAALLIAAKSN